MVEIFADSHGGINHKDIVFLNGLVAVMLRREGMDKGGPDVASCFNRISPYVAEIKNTYISINKHQTLDKHAAQT